MKVLKFGGTSVGTPERLRSVAHLVSSDEESKLVVLSAVSGTTNTLVQIGQFLSNRQADKAVMHIDILKSKYDVFINELFTDPEVKMLASAFIDKTFDQIRQFASMPFGKSREKELLAQGELISTTLFHLVLNGMGVNAYLISAMDLIQLNEDGEPEIEAISTSLKEQIPYVEENQIYITQGFICLNSEGDIDNLDRGGSDYSASLFGAALNVDEIQIWTDIDGMHNNDPRIVDNTYPIQHLSFDEAAELAYFGAKILHPASILPAQERQIRVRLKNTMKPDAPGSVIDDQNIENGLKAVAAKQGITAIKIKSSRMLLAHGFLKKVFEVFEQNQTSIDMITTSEIAVSLTIDDDTRLDQIVQELEGFGHVEVDQDLSIICVVGHNVMFEERIATRVLQALDGISLRMVSFGGSKNNISVLINSQDKEVALRLINRNLFRLGEIKE